LSKSIAIEPRLLELLQKVAGVQFFLRHSVGLSNDASKYRDAFFPDGKRPATDTKNDISKERRSLQGNDRTFMDSKAENWLWSCNQNKQTT